MQQRWTRRRVIGTSAAGAAAAIVGGGALQEMLAAHIAPAVLQSERQDHLLGRPDLLRRGQQAPRETINDWGEANGVETEVVMINQNETVAEGLGRGRSRTRCRMRSIWVSICFCCSPARRTSWRRSTMSTPRSAMPRAGGTKRWPHRPTPPRSRAAAPAFRSAPAATCFFAATTR